VKKKSKNSKLACTIILWLFALLFALPLIWMILASLKSSSEVFSRNWLPAVWKWENYKTVWTDTTVSLLRSFVNSIVIVVLGTGGQIIISSLSAYAFAKVNFKGKNIVFTLFLASMMIPVQATIIPRFILFYEIGLYNNLWSLILPSWFGVTSIFLLRQFYMGLPTDLMDAAKVDGAGHLRIFWQIMMPLTKPAMVSSAVLSFITIWNDYLSALIFLVNKKTYTVALAVRYWLFDDAQRYELTMASAASTIIPVVILFIFCQKYFVEGIATSGVKG
jgi:multiple sugar transport system permease protein